ncbi:hypothetical protein [Lactobacillus crispatus]|jgi:hypothetical protein|nr:hypothetical protein [Lactobacillus crispatus]MCT3539359.1 bacteriocin [Lactobacillus crispatus]
MYRVCKSALFIIISGICLISILSVIKEYDKEAIPNANTAITITTDSIKQSKKQVFLKLKQAANQGNYQLTLVKVKRINNKTSKVVYNFNSNLSNSLTIFRDDNVQRLKYKALRLQDLRGTYYTTANSTQLTKLKHILDKAKINYAVVKISKLTILENSGIIETYLPIILSMLGIVFIIMVIEKVSHFKNYAVLKLNGWSLRQIIIKDFKKSFAYFAISYLLLFVICLCYILIKINFINIVQMVTYSWELITLICLILGLLDLVSYSVLVLINIPTAIKGQTYTKEIVTVGYILKIFLVALVTINIFAFQKRVTNYIQDKEIMKMWINHHSGYVVQYSAIDDKIPSEEKKVEQRTQRLLNKSKDVIVSSNNQQYNPKSWDTSPTNGNVMIVNKNYLKYNHLKTITQKVIGSNLNLNVINILIPNNRIDQKSAFKKELVSFINFQHSLISRKKHVKMPKLKFITYSGNKKIFNYTIGSEIKDSISVNPIIVVDNDFLSPNFYFAAVSRGMIQFSNLHELERNISELKLTSYIYGITDAKTRLSNFNIKLSRQLMTMVLTILLSISQLIFIIIFISLAFLQNQRQRMAINKVFGKSNNHIILKLILINMLTDLMIILVLALIQTNSLIICIYMIPYLIVEFLVIMLLAHHAQKDLLLTLNHGN